MISATMVATVEWCTQWGELRVVLNCCSHRSSGRPHQCTSTWLWLLDRVVGSMEFSEKNSIAEIVILPYGWNFCTCSRFCRCWFLYHLSFSAVIDIMSRDIPSMWLLKALYLDLVPRYRYVYTEEQSAHLSISLFVHVCMYACMWVCLCIVLVSEFCIRTGTVLLLCTHACIRHQTW